MSIMLSGKRLLISLALTCATVAGAYLITTSFFESIYYLAQLLPIFLTTYLLVAWLIYLRRDDFLRYRPRNRPHVDTMAALPALEDAQILETKVSGEEHGPQVVVVDGLVQRRQQPYDWDEFWLLSMHVLVLSSLQLAAVSALLYYVFGVGAGI